MLIMGNNGINIIINALRLLIYLIENIISMSVVVDLAQPRL